MPVVPALPLTPVGPAGDGESGPCNWVFDPSLCCPDWGSYGQELRDRAIRYASMVLWAATGRQYGLCPVTVRPCGKYTSGGMPSIWGYTFSLYAGGGAGLWYPYIGGDGEWRNCACPVSNCGCRPDCQVYLPAPVSSVTSVNVDGAIVPDSAYRVDNRKWLVRTDGNCWPDHADYNVDSGTGFFEVSYVRGAMVPAALLDAAGTLACEFAKGCATGSCRLPGNVVSLARQGVTVQMMDLNTLLTRNLTGIPEVDQIIVSLNPHGLKERLRVYSPELRVPRMVTSI